jgi:hypothetical protein
VKTLIFDLGGVYFSDRTSQFIEQVKEKYALPMDVVTEVVQGALGSDLRTARISIKDFWKTASEVWNVSVDPETLSLLWLSGYVPIVGTVDIIKRLRHASYRTLFLSDNIAERVEFAF